MSGVHNKPIAHYILYINKIQIGTDLICIIKPYI